MRPTIALCWLLACGPAAFAQFEPEDAHVDLYFPQLADGGTLVQRWQTSFIFINPNASISADVTLWLYGNDGSPLSLDLGLGLRSALSFSVPPQGRYTLRSQIASPTILTGWAIAYANIPVQATVVFRALTGSTPVVDLTAPATLPSLKYRSAANRNLGVALANFYGSSISVTVQALDQNGVALGSAQVPLPALGHSSFVLNQLLPSLPSNYLGSVVITPNPPDSPNVFVAWTLNEDGGLMSTLPPGRLEWPISHWDRIRLVYKKALQAARTAYPAVNFDSPPVTLAVTPKVFDKYGQDVINAYASWPDGMLHIPYSISELMSDSESEIGFIVCHELGHQVQYRSPSPHRLYNSNVETDADEIGLILALGAGFDPYAAAGALSKLAMANGGAGLLAQYVADFEVILGLDPHLSYGDRINNLWNLLVLTCADPAASQTCNLYKGYVHPDFPAGVPLVRVPSPRER